MGVSSTGAFTYTIPIVVPPGTAGLVPSLSLDYSSQNGDGFEGIGWTLAGLPTITRCPRTFDQDKDSNGNPIHGSINYDMNDRFCMNGQRLVVIGGTYGQANSEYRTEIESFAKITANGTAGNGPAWFKVQTKSGQTLEFGNTTDSRVLAVGSTTARTWAVNKISDTKGNYLAVTYNCSASGGACTDATRAQYGEAYPIQINYSGNGSSNPVLNPYNSVQFSYTDRATAAWVPTYQAGALMETTKRLTEIKTCLSTTSPCPSGSVVTDYQLNYSAATSGAQHDELTSVQMCDGSGNCPSQMKLTFGWQGSRDTVTWNTGIAETIRPRNVFNNIVFGPTQLIAGDFNGDGLTDAGQSGYADGACPSQLGSTFYYASAAGGYTTATPDLWTYAQDGSYTTGPFCLGGSNGADPALQIAYFTGNGPADLQKTLAIASYCNITAYINATDHFFTRPSGSFGCNGLGVLQGDFDGDDHADFVAGGAYGDSPTLYHNNGDGSFTQSSFPGSYGEQSGDYDGDGCADVLYYRYDLNRTTLYYSCNPATASSYTTEPILPSPPDSSFIFSQLDADGDGKIDIIDDAGNLFLSSGTGLVKYAGTVWPQLTPNVIGDFNGDGKSDFLRANGSTYDACLSTGTTYACQSTFIPVPTGAAHLRVNLADWNSDGAQDIWLEVTNSDGTTHDLLYTAQYTPELVTAVTSGIGASITVQYDRLNKNGTFYAKYSDATFPTMDMDGPQYAVKQIANSNGLGGSYLSNYSYAGGKTEYWGRGFLGFSKVSVTDPQLNSTDTTTYFTAFPFTGQTASETKTWNGVTLSSVANCFEVHLTDCSDPSTPTAIQLGSGSSTRWFVPLRQTVASGNDTNNSPLPTVTTQMTYDCDTSPCYGNATVVVASGALLTDTWTKTTTRTYDTSSTAINNWYIDRMLTNQVQSVVGSSNITRHMSYAYDTSGSGLMTAENREPGVCQYELDNAYGYDAYGNKTSVQQSGAGCASDNYAEGIQTRTTSSAYDVPTYHGAFLTSVTNALNQSESWTYTLAINKAFGVPADHTGPNGQTTSWGYDGFGRKTAETRPDSTQTQIQYLYCTGLPTGETCQLNPNDSNDQITAAFAVMATPKGSTGAQSGAISIAFYDSLSRLIATDVQGFDGKWIRTATEYDSFARVSRASRPYYIAGGSPTPKWTVNSYTNTRDCGCDDPLGRPWLVTRSDSSSTAYLYDALVLTKTENLKPDGTYHVTPQVTVTTKNAEGLVKSLKDPNLKTTNYTYDSFGNLLTVKDPTNNITTTYSPDTWGRKAGANDDDMGNWIYKYDVLDELISQTDAKNQTTTLKYDVVGHLLQRAEPGGYSDWVYGVTPGNHDVGQLIQACTRSGSAVNCDGLASTDYIRVLTYDGKARPATNTISIDGTQYQPYTIAYGATDGRVSSVTYPSGFVEQYIYVTTYGYLSQLKDGASGVAYWTANARDQEMHLITSTAGNGVVTDQVFDANTGLITQTKAGTDAGHTNVDTFSYAFDSMGNLLQRQATFEGVTENACYDVLNRLTKYAIGGTSCTTGTIKKTAAYSTAGNMTKKSDVCNTAGCMTYGGTAGPHALTAIAGTVNGVMNPTFQYDANGNMTCELGAGQLLCDVTAARYVTWTSFNMVATVTEGASVTNALAFTYDSEHARLKQCKPNCTVPLSTTLYLNDAASGSMSEKAGTTWRDYVLADGKIVAERFNNSGTVSVRYFMLDHLNSIAVLTDESGTVVERDFYDAWGRRRNSDGTDLSACPAGGSSSQTTRGFTNQEELDGVCMVDLNARIYDPTIGRFLSADDVIPDQYGPQTLNRYSYVNNNPLSFTDPSGHDCTICEGFKPSFSDKELASQNSIAMSDCWGSCGGLGTAAGESMFSHSSSQGTAGVSGGAPSALTQATSNKSEGAPITGTAPQTSSGNQSGGSALNQDGKTSQNIENAHGTGNYAKQPQPIEEVVVTPGKYDVTITAVEVNYRNVPGGQSQLEYAKFRFTPLPASGFAVQDLVSHIEYNDGTRTPDEESSEAWAGSEGKTQTDSFAEDKFDDAVGAVRNDYKTGGRVVVDSTVVFVPHITLDELHAQGYKENNKDTGSFKLPSRKGGPNLPLHRPPAPNVLHRHLEAPFQ
jgi:RHS repeat-associated protein